MLNPADRWVWDFWHVQDGTTHHLYYLQAPKVLGDPELRHRHATIGHATSTDLCTWTEHGTVLTPGGPGTVDATATWTGCVVQGDDGIWRMFYTGSTFLSPDSTANIEVIALAVSEDLYTWTKDERFALRADEAWYEKLHTSTWPEEAWRDPWVYRADDGTWRMLVTARSNAGAVDDRGVVGHARSADLQDWEVTEPLTRAGAGFGQLEVLQNVAIEGLPFVVFSTHQMTLTAARQEAGGDTGTWIAPVSKDGEILLDTATNLTDGTLYSGRIINLEGTAVLLAFRTVDDRGTFLGGITDPIPVGLRNGKPELLPLPLTVTF